jgi:hypothetical protein
MTDVRSYTNGRSDRPGTAAPHDQGQGDFVNALQDAVRENPISAALAGVGVLWMFMGGSNTSLFGGGGRKSIFRTAMQGAEQVGDAVRDTAEHVSSSVSRTANVAAGTAAQVTDAVRQASAAVGDTASRTAGQAADAVSSAYVPPPTWHRARQRRSRTRPRRRPPRCRTPGLNGVLICLISLTANPCSSALWDLGDKQK